MVLLRQKMKKTEVRKRRNTSALKTFRLTLSQLSKPGDDMSATAALSMCPAVYFVSSSLIAGAASKDDLGTVEDILVTFEPVVKLATCSTVVH